MLANRAAIGRGLAAVRSARPQPSSLLRRNLKPTWRRGYASAGDSHAASSDLPWLAGAIAVTVPCCYYLWPTAAHGDAHHGHDEHGEEHEEEHEEHEDSAPTEEGQAGEDSPDASEGESSGDGDSADGKGESESDKGVDASSDTSNDDGDQEEGEDAGGEEKSAKPEGQAEKTSNKKVEGVQFKGKTSQGDDNNEMHDYRKRESDSKGAFKKRIDSAYQKNLGEGEHEDEEGKATGATATTPSGKQGSIDTKQHGLSTTPTRHSTQIDQDPEKSKKANGVPETAKSSTTIHPEMGKKK